MRRSVPVRAMVARSGMRLMSIRTAGWARRKFMVGTRLWPPARVLPSSPGSAVAIVWRGVGAVERSMHDIALGPSACTVRQCHAGEAVYSVKSGAGTVLDPDSGSSDAIAEGSMVHVEPGTAYRFAAGAGGM